MYGCVSHFNRDPLPPEEGVWVRNIAHATSCAFWIPRRLTWCEASAVWPAAPTHSAPELALFFAAEMTAFSGSFWPWLSSGILTSQL